MSLWDKLNRAKVAKHERESIDSLKKQHQEILATYQHIIQTYKEMAEDFPESEHLQDLKLPDKPDVNLLTSHLLCDELLKTLEALKEQATHCYHNEKLLFLKSYRDYKGSFGCPGLPLISNKTSEQLFLEDSKYSFYVNVHNYTFLGKLSSSKTVSFEHYWTEIKETIKKDLDN